MDRQKIRNVIREQAPQIRMHGGEFTITNIDEEAGTVEIQLSGTCTNCDLISKTSTAITDIICEKFQDVSSVNITRNDK